MGGRSYRLGYHKSTMRSLITYFSIYHSVMQFVSHASHVLDSYPFLCANSRPWNRLVETYGRYFSESTAELWLSCLETYKLQERSNGKLVQKLQVKDWLRGTGQAGLRGGYNTALELRYTSITIYSIGLWRRPVECLICAVDHIVINGQPRNGMEPGNCVAI